MNNVAKKAMEEKALGRAALESKELDLEALEGVSGGTLMTWDEMWERILEVCIDCEQEEDEICMTYLDDLAEQFWRSKRLDISCPKGLYKETVR